MLHEERGGKHKLTRSCAQNDPIDRPIKGFSSRDFENEVRHSRDDFFLFSSQNLDFKDSLDTEKSLEEEEKQEIQGLSCLNSLICSKHPRRLYIVKENVYL